MLQEKRAAFFVCSMYKRGEKRRFGALLSRSEVGESLRVPLFDSNPDGINCRFPSKKALSLSELG
jgi:hypothetical protein